MKKVAGFVLLSAVTYAALSCYVAGIAVYVASLLMSASYRVMASLDSADFYTAYDLVYYACATAPRAANAWYKADTHGFIWLSTEGDAEGYLIEKGGLIYKRGSYDRDTQRWHAVTGNIIARNVRLHSVYVHTHEGMVTEVSCCAESTQQKERTWHVAIKYTL